MEKTEKPKLPENEAERDKTFQEMRDICDNGEKLIQKARMLKKMIADKMMKKRKSEV